MALWGSLSFQNFIWSVASLLESLHDLIMVWLVLVLSLVVFISMMVFFSKKGALNPDYQLLEVVWTIIPMLILISIAYPSILLLCLQDSSMQSPLNSIKVISNQWNWQSELEESVDHLLDSESVDLLTSYESPILVKRHEATRVLTISSDVLHSLGIPSMGIKLDAAPGRISMTMLEVSVSGVFLGSCYELCGSGHSAMPIHFVSI